MQVARTHVYWIEGRAGGDVLVRSSGLAGVEEVLPPGVAVVSYVHEYGGGAYLATDNAVWFVRADDQQIWRLSRDGLRAVTTAPRHGEHRYADLRRCASGLLVAVRERHDTEAVTNELVMVPVDGSAAPWPVAQGWDFYSFPRPSPDGSTLAWTTWRHPLMPWDGTWLWTAEIRQDGRLGTPRHIAGGPEESVFQPEWSPGGVLHFVRSAIVAPAAWRAAAPKFQSHHADLLLGPIDTWRDRSLLRPGIAAHCPILAFHGGRDTVTPLRHVRELVTALGEQASLVVYPDEGHGLSQPDNVHHATHAELAHYRAALEAS